MHDAKVKSVLIADFQFLTRKSLEDLIGGLENFKIVHSLNQEEDLLHNLRELKPDILVLAIMEERVAHLKIIILEASKINCEILILTSSLKEEIINFLMKSGIKGIITKHCNEEEVVCALKTVAEGQSFVCKEILNPSADSIYNLQKSGKKNLSSRELEVLTLIAKGFTTPRIANTLHLSVHTINAHRKNILKKLDITSPIHLVAYAIDQGLVDVDLNKK